MKTTTTASTAGSPRILPFGDRGLLAEVASLDEAVALHAALAASRPRGVVGLVPAARTVLVEIDPDALSLAAARRWIAGARGGEDAAAPDPPIVELPIAYDGPDLADLAAALDIAPDELVAQHTAAVWTVAFTGFAPGFGYLVSADWPYDVPRRASPRTRVPAGAVGLAGEFTGAYPRETPGGWQLIGTTGAVLFDPTRAVPGLLAPGSRVRFVPTPPSVPLPPAAPPARVSSRGRASAGAPAFTVVSPGSLATVQDQGRPGHGAEGIAPAGAADRTALRTANRLVGNSEDAAGVEITLGGFRAVADVDVWIALTGAWGTAHVGGRTIDPYTAALWPRGAELRIDGFTHGVRGYLAVRGGIDGPRVAGSRSADTMSGLGPPPLSAGTRVALADPAPVAPIPPGDLHPWGRPPDALEIALAPGPRADWFTDAADLYTRTWTVSAAADRVGIRLAGTPLTRAEHGSRELPSEGMLPGAIQVPPDGLPVILGPDGPVTGGYPVVAVVADAARDALAQARPGTVIRFRHVR